MFGLDASDALVARARATVAEMLAEMSNGAVCVVDRDMRYLAVDGPLLAAWGYRPEVLIGRRAPDVVAGEVWNLHSTLVVEALAGNTVARMMPQISGNSNVPMFAEPLCDDDGTVVAAVVSISEPLPRVDPSAGRARELAPGAPHGDDAFDLAPVGMCVVGMDGCIQRINAALSDCTGYTADQLVGRAIGELAHPDDATVDEAAFVYLVEGGAQRYEMDTRIRDAHGHTVWVTACASIVRDEDGTPRHAVVSLLDCSARKLAEERLRRHAERDPLTLVHNRRRFERDVDAQLQRCRRFGEHAALLVIDVDGLKRVNDEHGHATGDALLRAVASSLRRRTRQVDSVARLGGDEFGMLLTHVEPREANLVAQQVTELVSQASVSLPDGRCLRAGASVGVAMLDDGSAGVREVLAAADRAMYECKRRTSSH